MKQAQPVISHILLCDDDPDDHYFFTLAVNNISPQLTLTCARSGEEMMRHLSSVEETDLPQLIFLDYTLPRDGGLRYLKKLKTTEGLRDIPVIMQADHMEEAIEPCYQAGADLLFQKPYKIATYSSHLKLIFNMGLRTNMSRLPPDKFVLLDPDSKKFRG